MSNEIRCVDRTGGSGRLKRTPAPRLAPLAPVAVVLAFSLCWSPLGGTRAGEPTGQGSDRPPTEKMLLDYYQQMSVPKPFIVRREQEFKGHQQALREKVLTSAGLWPLPDWVALDVRQSEPLDHPWCTVRRVYYQLWPGVYASGLLFMPKEFAERPAPAMLCPHGHWKDGNAHPEVQKRCLNFARLGYVTFSSTQDHYEDLYVGVSHQTLMVRNNVRALDYLESLDCVDKTRIGVAGASGGGLQAQMIAALDPRVKAATIVGLTCDFREIMFPDHTHCTCNHFPGVMQFTDHPEISALGLPTPVQYLTMNDWTKNFERDSFPTIRELYSAGGVGDRVDCQYYDTPHSYDKPKRERTYWWMERWLRGKDLPEPDSVPEPDDVETFLVETLANLSVEVPENKGFGEISRIYRNARGYQTPALAEPAEWKRYRERMVGDLKALLGEHVKLPRNGAIPDAVSSEKRGELVVERVSFPSEAGILVPAIILRKEGVGGKLPVVLIMDEAGKDALVEENGPGSGAHFAQEGRLVVLCDVRTFGALFSTGGKDAERQLQAWERNGIVWGRPVPGMARTDLEAVLDGVALRPDADMTRVEAIARNSGGLAIAVLFAAALDPRITSADVDLAGCCFEKRNLPLVSNVLQHGDVLQWAALVADRNLTLRNVPPEAGDPDWLAKVFAAVGNGDGLRIDP
ncbi:MAG: acetylxylan esterase [Planctomycetota bacterium]